MLQMAGRMGVLGTETAFEVLARANALAAEGRSIINLGIGQPDFPTPEHIVEAGRKALADGHHGYTPANGIPALRAAVAADLWRRHRVEVSPDQVLVVPGGKVTMFFAIMMFGEPGAEILYPNPGFPIYESVIRFSGATPVPVPLYESAGFSFSAEEVLEKITPRTRLLIINSPANPTGGVVPKAELDRLVAGLERHPHVAVMSDEIYGEILYDGAEHVSLLALSRAARPPHPARRLEQDLRDDRLAHGLRGVAEIGIRGRRAARDQLPLLRQRVGAICRYRRARRAARAGPAHGQRVCRAPRGDRRRAQQPARHPLRPAGRRLLYLPQHFRHRLRRPQLSEPAARRGRGGDDRRHQLWRIRRGLHPVLLRQQPARRSPRRWSGSAAFSATGRAAPPPRAKNQACAPKK